MTIAAIATPLGEGGIGIVRLSGPNSLLIAQKIFIAKGQQLNYEQPNYLRYGIIVDEQGRTVDEAMAVFMRSPHSYTAEDVVELQCHGSRAALEKVLSLAMHYGARLALPGEFTQRAFLNGRLDLSQAEAVIDIIKARTQASLKIAMRQHRGILSQEISKQRNALKDIIVRMEALIDYPEEDLEDLDMSDIGKVLEEVSGALDNLVKSSQTGRVLREGLRVVIVGRPNVGKSSLLNFLLQEERAIVSSIAGTTRDVIEESFSLGGIPLVLVDTAGIRTTQDEIEKIGVERTFFNMQAADLVLLMLDASAGLTDEDMQLIYRLRGQKTLVVVNKIDEQQIPDVSGLPKELGDIIYISVRTGQGLDTFKNYLGKMVFGSSATSLDDNIYVQNVRHEKLIKDSLQAVEEALTGLEYLPPDCIVIDLREAVDSLGMITGESVPDEIINEIFARFCIGK